MIDILLKNKKNIFAVIGFFTLWVGFHLPSILYGTQDTPLHVSYMSADEQSPVNGALHMLKEKSIFGLKNQNTLYYGPMFSVLALPPVLTDYSINYVSENVSSAESYKEFLVWDWGGILAWARVVSVLVGGFGLLGVFFLFQTKTLNPSRNELYPILATTFLASSFMYFEYSSFFRHWVFVVALLIWQVYVAIKIYESSENNFKLWLFSAVLTTASFGISYVSLIYLVYWLPLLVVWYVQKDWIKLKHFFLYVLMFLLGCALVVWWHPYAFVRILGQAGLNDFYREGEAPIDLLSENTVTHSFLFYARVIFINTFLLVPLGISIVFAFLKEKVLKQVYIWVLFLPAFVNYMLFSIPSEPESRYMLPTVVFSALLVLALYFFSREKLGRNAGLVRVGGGVLAVSFLLGCTQIVGWQRIILDGPAERREFNALLEEWGKGGEVGKILVIKGWPLGYVHTKGAYADYVARYDKSSYDLWKYILTLTPPEEKNPIDVYYLHENEELTEEMLTKYDHVVKHVPAQVGVDVLGRSVFDEFDLRPWHMWKYKKYQETFEVIK